MVRELFLTPIINTSTSPKDGLPFMLMRLLGLAGSTSVYTVVLVTVEPLRTRSALRLFFNSVNKLKSKSSMFSSGHTNSLSVSELSEYVPSGVSFNGTSYS